MIRSPADRRGSPPWGFSSQEGAFHPPPNRRPFPRLWGHPKDAALDGAHAIRAGAMELLAKRGKKRVRRLGGRETEEEWLKISSHTKRAWLTPTTLPNSSAILSSFDHWNSISRVRTPTSGTSGKLTWHIRPPRQQTMLFALFVRNR